MNTNYLTDSYLYNFAFAKTILKEWETCAGFCFF